MSRIIRLRSMDDQDFEVDQTVIECSMTLKNMLEDISGDTGVIPLPSVSSDVLKKVIAYANHHAKTVTEANKTDPWDHEFCKVPQDALFELILAANYLEIRPLLDLTCKAVANLIKGKSPEEIRKTFNITNVFTPEEEEQIRKENEWCEGDAPSPSDPLVPSGGS
mgnify:CR=1 FL=1